MATEAQAEKIITLLTLIAKNLGAGGAATSGGGGLTKAATSGASAPTRTMVLAAVTAVRDKLGPAASKRLVSEFGKAKSFDGVDKKNYAAMLVEAEKLLPGEDETGTEEPDTAEDDGL